jgi:hypothetical protein
LVSSQPAAAVSYKPPQRPRHLHCPRRHPLPEPAEAGGDDLTQGLHHRSPREVRAAGDASRPPRQRTQHDPRIMRRPRLRAPGSARSPFTGTAVRICDPVWRSAEIHRGAGLIDGPIQVFAGALDPHIGLVHSPARTDRVLARSKLLIRQRDELQHGDCSSIISLSRRNLSWAKQGSVANFADWSGWPKFAGNGLADQQARIEFKGSHFGWDSVHHPLVCSVSDYQMPGFTKRRVVAVAHVL